jgi:hypothetical protein
LSNSSLPYEQTKSPKRKRRVGCTLAVLCGIVLIGGFFAYQQHQDDVEFVGTPCSAQLLSELHNYPYKIAFDRDSDSQPGPFIMDADGNNTQSFRGHFQDRHAATKGPYSARIEYGRTWPVFGDLMVSEGSSDHRLATGVTTFEWSPVKDDLAYGTYAAQIFSASADGTHIHPIYDHGHYFSRVMTGHIDALDWSPDGQYLVFVFSEGLGRDETHSGMDDTSFQIYIARADGSAACRVSPDQTLDATFHDHDPVWLTTQ